ncbi:hypothetical protein L227DRAFT_611855 [Lentinus tigrinus ALCF2SS1-6]|uniref:Uncharacterized protein n=1 Tax=Lentinus tigrinus ALCF2SS1-6 TaxID=1328759 RepID=A0A5C2S8P4_9APHY|nr:hypothetical protein L227DRAFT_611855 [Lentinus tigrinus ALCF2SS1-6]
MFAPSEPECYGVSNIQIHDQFVIWMLDTLFGRQVEEHLFPGPGFITYTLLDAAHILVTSDRWDELRVYRFDPPDESADGVLRLGFPFEDRCRPRIQQSSIPVLPPNVPFWPDAKLRILTVFYYSMVSTPPIGALMIPYTTFRRLLHPKSTTKPTYTPPLRVPWEQWGPQGSVDLQVPADKRVVLLNSYPYGSRVSFNAFEMPGGRLGPDWWKQMDVVTFDLNPYGDKYADNPYVACPPRPARWSAEQVKQWIRDESAIPHSASSVPRHQESPTLYDSTMIAHCYGFTEFFPIQLPASVHEIGFRTHFLMEKNGSEAIESAD